MLVGQDRYVHVKWSIEECRLWVWPCFSSNVLHFLFVFFGWFERWEVSVSTIVFFLGCCFQDLFSIARSILVQFLSSFFSISFVSVHVVHPYSNIDTTAAWKKFCFYLSDKTGFDMIDRVLIALPAFAMSILISLSVDETLLPRYVNLSTNFRKPPFEVEMSPSWLKHIQSVLFAFT